MEAVCWSKTRVVKRMERGMPRLFPRKDVQYTKFACSVPAARGWNKMKKKGKKEKTLIKSIPFPAFVITAESYCKYGVSTNKDLEYMSRALEIRLSLRGWNYKASVMWEVQWNIKGETSNTYIMTFFLSSIGGVALVKGVTRDGNKAKEKLRKRPEEEGERLKIGRGDI